MRKLAIWIILGLFVLSISLQTVVLAEPVANPKIIEWHTTEQMGYISFNHTLEHGAIILRTSYWTDYNKLTWRITDNKNIHIKVEVLRNTLNTTLFIEHMHADCFIVATSEDIDGLLQDTMDDKIHGAEQPGFLITPSHEYSEIFSVEGYSKYLLDGWMALDYGSMSEDRLTETELKQKGVYGSEFAFVYDICIKDGETGYFYKTVFTDDFIIKNDMQAVSNTGGINEPPKNNGKLTLEDLALLALIFIAAGIVVYYLFKH